MHELQVNAWVNIEVNIGVNAWVNIDIQLLPERAQK